MAYILTYSLSKEQRSDYIEKLKNEKHKLNAESKQFIDDILFIDPDRDFDSVGEYWNHITQKRLRGKERAELSDIFPESVYPALDLMLGEHRRKDFIDLCERVVMYPYTWGYYRRMIRSTNYLDHFDRIGDDFFSNFVTMSIMDWDVMDALKSQWGENDNVYVLFPELYAMEIDRHNPDVIEYIKGMMLSESNTQLLSRSEIDAVFMSHDHELIELLGRLLLAAKLQEGLRQNICEAMDCGLEENFVYFVDLICDHDLFRFSSVKRAIATFTGIGDEEGDRITKKELKLIHDLVHDEVKAEELVLSKNNVEALLGMWYLGTNGVDAWTVGFDLIRGQDQIHSHLLLSYLMRMLQNDKYSAKVAKEIIGLYARKDQVSDSDFLKVMACFLRDFIAGSSFSSYGLEKRMKEDPLKWEDDFASKDELRIYFDTLERAINSMPRKGICYDPCIFPWHSVSLVKDDLAFKMGLLALMQGEELQNRFVDYVKDLGYHTSKFINILYSDEKTKRVKDMLIELLGDRNNDTDSVLKIIQKNGFAHEYLPELTSLFRLKTTEIRQAVIRLLGEQPIEEQVKIMEELLRDKNQQKRLGALDLLLQAKKAKKITSDEISHLLEIISTPTISEQVLIEELRSQNDSSEMIKELYDPEYQFPEIPLYHRTKKLLAKSPKVFKKSPRQIYDIVQKLSELYTRYEDYEYKAAYGSEDVMLSYRFYPVKSKEHYWTDRDIKDYPLSEVWVKFYEEEIGDFDTLHQIYEMVYCGDEDDRERLSFIDIKGMCGVDLFEFRRLLSQKPLKYCGDRYDDDQVFDVLSVLYDTYQSANKSFLFDYARSLYDFFFSHYSIDQAVKIVTSRYGNRDKEYSLVLSGTPIFNRANLYMGYYQNDEEFKQAFSFKYKTDREMAKRSETDGISYNSTLVYLTEMAYAVVLGLVEQDAFYRYILDQESEISDYIRGISDYLDGTAPEENDEHNTMTTTDPKALAFVKEHGKRIIDFMIAVELKRGDMPLRTSKAIRSIKRMEGIDNLIAVLNALGSLKLDRSSWYWSGGDTKQATLSHLLKVSYPRKEETALDLKEALGRTRIETQRLIEVAMYAPQWIPLLEEYLGWKGMASGCYYFHAHISDVDRKKEALFAQYTPIAIEDLESGAFDIDWFRSAYDELGEEYFEMLYESAKYISDGAKHGRARKFADAVLGRLDLKEAEETISEKRNKDLLAAYGLIPLTKNKTKDLLRRYKFIQNFLKESKQFGAQRRTSEAKAAQIALENLSRNAGYADVTRLTWTMETELIDDMKALFEPKEIGDITAYISVNEKGQSSIIYEKGEKQLKSLPAKLKKDPYINTLKEAHNALKEQYRRSRKMLEEAMEDAIAFESREIDNLLQKNPIIAPLLRDLVMKSGDSIGYYGHGNLRSAEGEMIALKDDAEVYIAHSLDLYNSGKWAEYQKDLFDRKVKQPFKQVFRELYIKTEDELGKIDSRRYAGHQIQPAKTVAVLKTRRWVVDGDEGLQKVYYKQNIIAKIYALADWFSPADAEAPTLEWVQFYDRKNYKVIKIDDVPNLIFTEVMRDVDLAVSVAHIGGVDPETTHSTVEMRKAIIQFNLPLFKLKNVTFNEKHALIQGALGDYSIHLGSGLVHQKAGAVINVLPVHAQHRGRLFLPFVDEDPKTAEIMSKVVLFAQDTKIKDPSILSQIKSVK